MYYAFLGSELTYLIGEWLKKEKLNVHNVAPPPVPLDPSTRYSVEIEISSDKTSRQSFVVEVDEVTATSDLSTAFEVPVAEPNLSVAAVQPLINLEEKPIATDAEDEPQAADVGEELEATKAGEEAQAVDVEEELEATKAGEEPEAAANSSTV